MAGLRLSLVIEEPSGELHNEQYADDFDALFTFLAHYPSQSVRFLCEIRR